MNRLVLGIDLSTKTRVKGKKNAPIFIGAKTNLRLITKTYTIQIYTHYYKKQYVNITFLMFFKYFIFVMCNKLLNRRFLSVDFVN